MRICNFWYTIKLRICNTIFKENYLCFLKEKYMTSYWNGKINQMVLRQYLLVGEMPKVVKAFLDDNKQFENYNEEKREILKTYRNDIEIDFLIITGDKTNVKIAPIEVKSTKKYTTSSLDMCVSTFKKRISNSYIIHPKNLYIREDGVICIPAYMTFCL